MIRHLINMHNVWLYKHRYARVVTPEPPNPTPLAAELYMLIPSHGSVASRTQNAGSELRASRPRVTVPEVSGVSPDLTMEKDSSVSHI